MKKILALLLAVIMCLSCLAGCGTQGQADVTTEPEQTEPAAEANVLKVLTLGHSLAVDAGHMLALIAKAEGYENMVVGTLYYSGCPLYRHVEFLQNDSREYDLYISSTETAEQIPNIMQGVTMKEALRYDYWDIIILQGGVFEIAESLTYTDGNLQMIQNFVNENKRNPLAAFGWNMAWAPPVDDTLRSTYPGENNIYITNYQKYNDDRTALYNAIAKCVGDHIVTDDSFEYLIPSGTAIENALSSYLTETDLHRDYVHTTDLGRVIASYTWYCSLVGIEKLDQIKLEVVPKQFFKSTVGFVDWVLTDAEKALILEAVNNALAEPLQVTQSQHTEAPA